jgi:ABC-type bacteriocin/lantibiotic exporter with double-glycine peptidase domain
VKQLSGKELKESHVAAIIGTNRSTGTTPEKMVKGLGLLGFSAKPRAHLGLKALRSNFQRKRGQILLVQSGDTAHWVVLADYTDGKIVLMDPWRENKTYLTYTEEEFITLWNTTLLGKKVKQLSLVIE